MSWKKGSFRGKINVKAATLGHGLTVEINGNGREALLIYRRLEMDLYLMLIHTEKPPPIPRGSRR